jgi:hypothetical protein
LAHSFSGLSPTWAFSTSSDNEPHPQPSIIPHKISEPPEGPADTADVTGALVEAVGVLVEYDYVDGAVCHPFGFALEN